MDELKCKLGSILTTKAGSERRHKTVEKPIVVKPKAPPLPRR